MWQNPQESADLVTFTEEIVNGKLFLCAVVTVFARKAVTFVWQGPE